MNALRRFLVLDPVRFVGVGAQTTVAIGFMVGVIAFESADAMRHGVFHRPTVG